MSAAENARSDARLEHAVDSSAEAIVHLALGDSAAGCVRAALQTLSAPGTVFVIPDDLSHGPLENGDTRSDYLRACLRGYDDGSLPVTDACASWHALSERLAQQPSESILIWSGDNVSEMTFLAMACWWLDGRAERVLCVAIPETDACRYVAAHSPEELASLLPFARELSAQRRTHLARDFLRIRRETGSLRRWHQGRILGAPIERYDPLLLACCPTTWTPAGRLIGAAMSRCDGHNLMSDLFFSSRLQLLIDAGQIEADGPRTRLHEFAVRLVGG